MSATNHPNRSKKSISPAANPAPADIKALRERVQAAQGLASNLYAQNYCAALVYTTVRNFQQWEYGESRMHPATWELLRIKVGEHNLYQKSLDATQRLRIMKAIKSASCATRASVDQGLGN